MENWLEKSYQNARHFSVRLVIIMLIVFLSLAGFVSLIGDLGLGDEIKEYRVGIWVTIIVVSLVSVLANQLYKEMIQTKWLKNELGNAKKQLDDAKQREDSLLRLMETYKKAAYVEVFEHLNRLLILVANQERWQENRARITKVRIRPYSGIEKIDPDFAEKERIDVIINIGAKDNLSEGMEFLVRDTEIPLDYGVISVRKVYKDGSVCSIVEENDPGFWKHIMEAAHVQNKTTVVEIGDNLVVPNLPNSFDSITPENAEEIRAIISKIANNQ